MAFSFRPMREPSLANAIGGFAFAGLTLLLGVLLRFDHVFLLISVVFSVLGIPSGTDSLIKYLRWRKFVRDGARVDAVIVKTKTLDRIFGDPDLHIASGMGWEITAQAVDPMTGQQRTYEGKLDRSRSNGPDLHDPLLIGAKTVPVYVDRADPDRYYMDTRMLLPYNLHPELFAGKGIAGQIQGFAELEKMARANKKTS